MQKIRIIAICCAIFYSLFNYSKPINFQDSIIIDGALVRTNLYIDLIKEKKIGLVVNQSSYIQDTHLVDSLINLNIDVLSIFSPEHGFKGDVEAGKKIENNFYNGITIYSLYGENKKPSKSSLKDIDFVLFDLQDVGIRFYTYISTLHYVMEACAENKVSLIVLDRYNPHMYYTDGPILKKEFTSFVGMHSVPIVYGMTIGEYALMINQEGWLKDSLVCDLSVVPLSKSQINHNNQYFNSSKNYILKNSPSPNLKTTKSIKSYPTLCLFEGTPISIGRGTDKPFEIIGSSFFSIDDFEKYNLSNMSFIKFTPKSRKESINPKYKDEECTGIIYNHILKENMIWNIDLDIVINIYNIYLDERPFFNSFFQKLAGSSELEFKIKNGWSENEIRDSWQIDLQLFQEIRKKYLIYPRVF